MILVHEILCFSSKIHENDVKREIQTTNVNLAPEIIQVFAQSQIFHDHKPLIVKPKSEQPVTFTLGSPTAADKPKHDQIIEAGSRDLLNRLEEGNEFDSSSRWRWATFAWKMF